MSHPIRTLLIAVPIVAVVGLGLLGGCLYSKGSSTAVSTVPAPSSSVATAPSGVASAAPDQSAPATEIVPPKVDTEGGAIGTSVTVSGQKKPAIGTIPEPKPEVAVAGAKKILASVEGATITTAKVDAMTQDKKGHWWVLLDVTDTSAGAGKALVEWDGKAWSDHGWGATITSTDLPPDVKF